MDADTDIRLAFHGCLRPIVYFFSLLIFQVWHRSEEGHRRSLLHHTARIVDCNIACWRRGGGEVSAFVQAFAMHLPPPSVCSFISVLTTLTHSFLSMTWLYLSVNLSIYLYLSLYLSIFPSFYLSSYLFIYQSNFLTNYINVSFCLCFLSTHLSITFLLISLFLCVDKYVPGENRI